MGSYPTVSPLPARMRAVCSLWRFPWGCPRRALPGTVASWSPDFPRQRTAAVIRPSAHGGYGGSGGRGQWRGFKNRDRGAARAHRWGGTNARPQFGRLVGLTRGFIARPMVRLARTMRNPASKPHEFHRGHLEPGSFLRVVRTLQILSRRQTAAFCKAPSCPWNTRTSLQRVAAKKGRGPVLTRGWFQCGCIPQGRSAPK